MDFEENKPKKRTKAGRPRAVIDKKTFENLCGLQCTKQEICDWFEITDKTLEKWVKENYERRHFSEVFRQYRGKGKISLRRAQFQLAQKSTAMAIFLGKNYLGQKDKTEQEQQVSVTDNTPKFNITFISDASEIIEDDVNE